MLGASIADVEKERTLSSTVPTSVYDGMCVPDLGSYLGYNPSPIMSGDDGKLLSSSAPTHISSPATPAPTNNNFLEGK